ncbi:hypothetical protein [Salimicrobium halophilum]|uniref:Hook-length control protein FliK n=1 Tax=Salimicrobium halophilum TaxID=86666 RepID=A0A1G8QCE7_9BACI|nr:hypothetical protein [Salimicrobium halophilum]SDJ02233.1 hypothetical protein SAMN04490247_0522 [Salimicrobium halophilum]
MNTTIQSMFHSLQKVQKVSSPALSAGKVINGKVAELLPKNRAIVDIGGKQVHARLETSLTKGQNYLFQVQPGKEPIHLKVLANQPGGDETVSLQKWMQSHGMKANNQTLAFAKMLMDSRIPFNAQELKQAFSMLQSSKSPQTVAVLKEMFEKQLPIRPSVFHALTTSKQTQLQTLFNQLSKGGGPFQLASRASTLLSSIVASDSNGSVQQAANQKLMNEAQANQSQSFRVLQRAGVFPSTQSPGSFRSNVLQQGQNSIIGNLSGSKSAQQNLFQGMQKLSVSSFSRSGEQPVIKDMNQMLPLTATHRQGQGTRGVLPKNGVDFSAETAEKIQNLFRQQLPLSGKETQKLSQWMGQFNRMFTSGGESRPQALLQSFVENHRQLMTQGTFQKLTAPMSGTERSSIEKVINQIPFEAMKFSPNSRAATSEDAIRMMQAAMKKIHQTLETQLPPSLQKTLTEWTVLTEKVSPLPLQERLLLQVRAFQQMSGLDDEAILRQNNSQPEPSMKTGLLALLGEGQTPKAEAARNLLHFFNSMQMTASQETAQSLQFSLQFPGQLLEARKDIHVNVEGKKNEDGTIDPNHCHILFYLDLENLKETVIDLQVRNRGVHVTVFNEAEQLPEVAGSFETKLKNGLENAGYSLASMQVKAGRGESRVEEHKQTPSINFQGVDFRV